MHVLVVDEPQPVQGQERLDMLDKRMAQFGLSPEPYRWYRDLRAAGLMEGALLV